MRNLKRALSLTLASVMLLGMMVVGSSAAAGYDDVKETDNVEAIEVLQTVGVMVGDERGFGPDRAVNRAEMDVVDAVKNYIFLTGIDLGTSNLKNKTANAAGILTDGTFIEFSMDMKDSEQADESKFSAHPLWNTWCTYTVDKDGVYTLTEVKSLAAMNAVGSKEKAGQYHDANYSNRDIDDKHVSLKSSDGSTKNLVYSNKDKIAKESYNATDDERTWERVVISNGEEVTLTEKGDKNQAHDFVDTIEFVENAINESDKTTVLYEQVWGIGKGDATSSNSVQLVEKNAPSLKGSILYVNTDANKGFYVSSDVKSVLIQKNDGKSSTTFGSGTSDLESILEDLNFDAATNSYCFKISAILTNGRATTVIIHDWTETGAKGNGGGGNNDVPPTDTWTLTLTD